MINPSEQQRADANFYYRNLIATKPGQYYGTHSSNVLVVMREDAAEMQNGQSVRRTNCWDAARVLAGWMKFEEAKVQ